MNNDFIKKIETVPGAPQRRKARCAPGVPSPGRLLVSAGGFGVREEPGLLARLRMHTAPRDGRADRSRFFESFLHP